MPVLNIYGYKTADGKWQSTWGDLGLTDAYNDFRMMEYLNFATKVE